MRATFDMLSHTSSASAPFLHSHRFTTTTSFLHPPIAVNQTIYHPLSLSSNNRLSKIFLALPYRPLSQLTHPSPPHLAFAFPEIKTATRYLSTDFTARIHKTRYFSISLKACDNGPPSRSTHTSAANVLPPPRRHPDELTPAPRRKQDKCGSVSALRKRGARVEPRLHLLSCWCAPASSRDGCIGVPAVGLWRIRGCR